MEWDDLIARSRELEAGRLAAWLPYEVLCGEVVSHFTLQHWVWLAEEKNAFLCGEFALAGDVLQFLWAVQLDFDWFRKPDAKWQKKVLALDHQQTCDEIEAYLTRAMFDLTPGGGGQQQSIEIAAFAAYWIHRFGHDYGWTDEKTLNTPVCRLIQLEKVGRAASGDGSAFQTRTTSLLLKKMEAQRQAQAQEK